MKRISKMHIVEEQMRKEGKIQDLDSPKDIAIMVKINKWLAKRRADFRRKQWKSWLKAKNVRLM
jgi:hypothetical protein